MHVFACDIAVFVFLRSRVAFFFCVKRACSGHIRLMWSENDRNLPQNMNAIVILSAKLQKCWLQHAPCISFGPQLWDMSNRIIDQ